MRGRVRKAAEETEVDLTPMLDVVFILLIFFIVTSTFLQEKALLVEPPPPSNNSDTPPPETPTILIRIDESSTITVNRRLTNLSSVRANIERLRAETPGMPVIIQAHPSAKNGVLLTVRDQAAGANVEQVNIVLDAEE